MTRNRKIWFLVAYGLLMLWLLFGQRLGQDNDVILQLRPLATLQRFWRVLRYSTDPGQLRHALVNLVGNVVMFIPLGFLIPWIWKFWQKWWRHALLMAGIIVAVEILQIVTALGTCDIDDLILNLVGTGLGYLCWIGVHKIRKR